MLSFCQYLSVNHVSLAISSAEIVIWLPGWIEYLQITLHKLYEKNVISQRIFTICADKFMEWQDNPTHYIKHYKTIEDIDNMYQKIIFFTHNDMVFSPRKLPIVGGYPFPPHVSGVSLEIRLVIKDEQRGYEFTHQHHTASAVGSKANAGNLKKRIKTRIGDIAWINESFAHLGFSITELEIDHPHAELIWCIEYSEQLLHAIAEEPHFTNLPLLNDNFPYAQLTQTPRLEVITSSSCCAQCRMLFAGLRWTLEKMHVHLPIILYADTPYNVTAALREMQGSVYTVTSSGVFFNTNVQCDVPHCVYPSQEQIPVEMWVPKKLSSKEEVDYLCLLYLGGLAFMDLLAHGVEEETLGTINPLTYIAPDTLIIYAAEQLPRLKSVSPQLKSAIQYLAKTLDEMDLTFLISWRATFTEQLHWLLISHLDPRYRESARRNLSATNTSFLIRNHVQGDTDAHRFYAGFALLWKTIKNLTENYRHMLHYVTVNFHQRMPLGVGVGPLSANMRKRVFPQQSYELSARNLGRMSIYSAATVRSAEIDLADDSTERLVNK